MEPELDPATYGLTIWDLDREFLTGGLGGTDRLPLGEILAHPARRLLPHGRHRVHAHPGARRAALDPAAGRRRPGRAARPTTSATSSRSSTRPRRSRPSSAPSTSARSASDSRGPNRPSPSSTRCSNRRPTPGSTASVMGMAHRGRLNVLANIVGQVLRPDLPRVRGRHRSRLGPGLGRREVPPWARAASSSRGTATSCRVELSANPSHLEAVDPVVVGMARAKQDLIDHARGVPGPAAPAARRRRLRRPGRGRRDAPAGQDPRLPGGRHRPPRHQQPARLHHAAGVGPFVGVQHRHRQDGPGAHPPRERRRSRGVCPGGPPGVRLPPAVPQGRRHRHDLLPPARPQRGRRSELHPAADVQAHRRQALGPHGSTPRRSSSGATSASRRPRRRSPTSRPGSRARSTRRGSRRRPRGSRPAGPISSACLPRIETGVDRARLDHIFEVLNQPPDGFTVHPKLAKQFEARAKMWRDDGEVDWALGETMAFGSLLLEGTDIRLAGQDSRRGTFSQRHSVVVDYETGAEWMPAQPAAVRTRASSGSTTRCSPSTPGSASSTATRWSTRSVLVGVGGAVRRLRQRRADHHRPVHRRRRGQVGRELGAGDAAAPRLRGSGPGALVGPHRAVPHPGRRGQHPGRQLHDRGPVLPPAAPPDAPRRPQAAGGVHARSRCCGPAVGPIADRRSHPRARSSRCFPTRTRRRPTR